MTPISDSQLLVALNWRYAVKAFDPSKKIPAATWAVLEDAMVLSPSSYGLQPYRFVVVQDPAVRAKLMPYAHGQSKIVDASHLVVFTARTSIEAADIDAYVERIAEVRGVTVESLAGYREMMAGPLLYEAFKPIAPHWAARQAYIALGNLLTSAALLGVDAGPMEGFVPAEFDAILGLPAQGFSAVVLCALGYRAAGDKYASLKKVRSPKSTLIHTV